MCTVSWFHYPGGYELFCNRDERLTRQAALPPRAVERDGVRLIAPADGDFGGTWIGANEYGLSLCLVNRYDEIQPRRSTISRGLLLLDWLDARSSAEIAERSRASDLAPYQPFSVVILQPDRPAALVHWNGQAVTIDREAEMPLISSSFDSQGVAVERRRQFERMLTEAGDVTADVLWRYHRSHVPGRGPYSTCMHRDDAQTMCFSHVRVTAGVVEFSWVPAAPCTVSHYAGEPAASIARRLKDPDGQTEMPEQTETTATDESRSGSHECSSVNK